MSISPVALPYPDKIARSSEKSSQFLEISAEMGDTLKQTAPKGLNPVRDAWKIAWVAITAAEKLLLEATLKTHGSWGVYSWTPCYETEEQYFRLIPDGYSVTHKGGNNDFTIKCELQQVFDIVIPVSASVFDGTWVDVNTWNDADIWADI